MTKPLPKVESANALDSTAYRSKFVPPLESVFGAHPELRLDFATAAELVALEKKLRAEVSGNEARTATAAATARQKQKQKSESRLEPNRDETKGGKIPGKQHESRRRVNGTGGTAEGTAEGTGGTADTERVVDDLEACFQLLKASSMQDYKQSSVQWSAAEKRREMRLPDMRYLLVRERETGVVQGSVQGFISFMITYEDGFEVVYVYEIHMAESLRGKGVGATLMGVVEEVGRRAGLMKVMLTVFVSNEGARRFYGKLGYVLDEYSPRARKLRGGVVKEPDYLILSKLVSSTATTTTTGKRKRKRGEGQEESEEKEEEEEEEEEEDEDEDGRNDSL